MKLEEEEEEYNDEDEETVFDDEGNALSKLEAYKLSDEFIDTKNEIR
jgi:hypothetical protein